MHFSYVPRIGTFSKTILKLKKIGVGIVYPFVKKNFNFTHLSGSTVPKTKVGSKFVPLPLSISFENIFYPCRLHSTIHRMGIFELLFPCYLNEPFQYVHTAQTLKALETQNPDTNQDKNIAFLVSS